MRYPFEINHNPDSFIPDSTALSLSVEYEKMARWSLVAIIFVYLRWIVGVLGEVQLIMNCWNVKDPGRRFDMSGASRKCSGSPFWYEIIMLN